MTSDQNLQQDLSEEEIDRLIGEHEFDKRQTLQLEILNELFDSGLGWDKKAVWRKEYHPEDTKKTKFILSLKQDVMLYAASCFVQKNKKYIDVKTHVELSDREIYRALVQKIADRFADYYPNILTANILEELAYSVINGVTIDPRMSFALYSGKKYMLPGNSASRLWRSGYCDLNTWREPAYRQVEAAPRDAEKPLGSLQDLLDFAIKTPLEREILLNWLGWCLKCEHLKPRWAIFLFSETKGTGKSSILELAQALFGLENTANENGIDGLTQQFAGDSLSKKFIKIEEVKLSSHSDAGNKMKEYITGEHAFVDVKHQSKQTIPLSCAFMLTSNHRPTWLEGGERRYYIIDMDHEGHAHGEMKNTFDEICQRFYTDLANQQVLKRWYIELTQMTFHPDFDAMVLQPKTIGSPLMKELMTDAKVELREVLEDLFQSYRVTVIPSSQLQALVDHFKMRNLQALRNTLKELGWRDQKLRFGGKQNRCWIGYNLPTENGRIQASVLSAGIKEAVQHGYTWWKLEEAIEQGWHKLYSKKLARGNLHREDTNEVQRVTDYAGPYLDSSSNEPFELRDPVGMDISF